MVLEMCSRIRKALSFSCEISSQVCLPMPKMKSCLRILHTGGDFRASSR